LHSTPQDNFAGLVKPDHAAAVLTQIKAEKRTITRLPSA
jgi:hypothetical protein